MNLITRFLIKNKEVLLNLVAVIIVFVAGLYLVIEIGNASTSQSPYNARERVINQTGRIYSYECSDVTLINSRGQQYIGRGLSNLNILIEDRIVKANFIQMKTQDKIDFCKIDMKFKKVDTAYIIVNGDIRVVEYKGLL